MGTMVPGAYADQAKDFYKAGQAAEAKQDYDSAYANYRRALDLKPSEIQYQVSTHRAQFEAAMQHVHQGEILRDQKHYPEALVEMQKAIAIDPANFVAAQEVGQINDLIHPPPPRPGEALSADAESSLDQRLSRASGPAELGPVQAGTLADFVLSGDPRVAYQTVGKIGGLNVIFDPAYAPNSSTRVNLSLHNVSVLEALRILDMETSSFYTVVTPNTILVATDNSQKRDDLEPVVLKTFYLSNVAAADLNEVATAIRSTLTLTHLTPVPPNMLVMRDTPDKVTLVQKLIDDLDKSPPEVIVDVHVIQVNRDLVRDLGLLPPNSATIGLASTNTNNSTSTTGTTTTPTTSTNTPTLNELAHLNSNNFSITINNATLNALLSDSNTRTLQEPQLRAVNNVKSTLQIGQRIPIATGSFQPGIGGVGINPLVNTQFTFTPIGVNIDITPQIHGGDEITLKTHIEISEVDGNSNIGGITEPIIGQRVIDNTIDLKDGASNVLAGLLEDQITHNIQGVPGLNEIPLLKWLFSTTNDETVHTEFMIVLTPHVVRRLDVSRFNQSALDTGVDKTITIHEMPPSTAVAPGPSGDNVAPAPPGGATAAGIAPPAAPLLAMDPVQLIAAPNSPVRMRVTIANAQSAYSLSFHVDYDPKLLEVESVSDAGFLSQGGQVAQLVHREDAGSGTAVITLSRPPGVAGVSGNGSVVEIVFRSKGSGMGKVNISHLVGRNAGGALLDLQSTGSSAVTIR